MHYDHGLSPRKIRKLLEKRWMVYGCVNPLNIACWEIKYGRLQLRVSHTEEEEDEE
jgi:hypothetical protein